MRKFVIFLWCIGLASGQLYAQIRTISGKVTDEANNPLVGATVAAGGGKGNAAANRSGTFSITFSQNPQEVEMSSVGLATKRLFIPKSGDISGKISTAT